MYDFTSPLPSQSKKEQRVFSFTPATIQHLFSHFSDRPRWLFSYTIHAAHPCLEVSTNHSICHVLSGSISNGSAGRCESIYSVLPRAKTLLIKTNLASSGFFIWIKINPTFQFLFQCDLHQSPFRQVRPLWKKPQQNKTKNRSLSKFVRACSNGKPTL